MNSKASLILSLALSLPWCSAIAAAPACPPQYQEGGLPGERTLVVACLLERLFSKGSATLSDILAADAVLIEAQGTPYPGEFCGQRLLGFDKVFASTWRDVRVTVDEIYTSPNGAVALLRLRAVAVKTGKAVDMPILERYRFAPDGKVTLIEPFYWDTAALAEAAGVRVQSSAAPTSRAADARIAAEKSVAPGCPDAYKAGGMPADRRDLVACFIHRFLAGGLGSLGNLLADDAVLVEAANTPYPGEHRRPQFSAFEAAFKATWRTSGGVVLDIYVSPSGAVTFGRFEAVSAATGRRITMPILERYVFAADGRVQRIEPFYFDTTVLRQVVQR
jgi:uncharacterized protein